MKFTSSGLALGLSLSLCSAAPSKVQVEERQNPVEATVVGSAPRATYVGLSTGTVDSFKGIPFSQSVAGRNRLTAPKAITANLGTVDASMNGPSCPSQSMGTTVPAIPGTSQVMGMMGMTADPTDPPASDEDCLTLNVQRPAGLAPNASLPVVYWIYGGGFEGGSTSSYDATELITNSITQKEPIVYVAVNYRLSAFGFLAGKEVKNAGVANLGLLDQRLGLQWVADNIRKFGGDPAKVTIWGESAGSISVLDQMIAYDGNNKYKGKPLFRGAVMNSGSIIPSNPVDGFKGQAVYDGVVQAAGCKGKANTLQCLRNVDFDTFYQACSSQPGIFSYDSVALAYLPRPDGVFLTQSPELLIKANKFAHVPFIIGDLEDEGTLFSQTQPNITTQAELIDYFHTVFFPDVPRSRVKRLIEQYPNNPAAGSPFRTGQANEIHPEYKRLAAIIGDTTFTITRRVFLTLVQQVAPNLRTYSYLGRYDHGTPVLGTFHGSDITQIYGYTPGPPSETFQSYYISFFNHLNPNTKKLATLPTWPLWPKTKNLVAIDAATNSIIPDNFRQGPFNFLINPANTLRI